MGKGGLRARVAVECPQLLAHHVLLPLAVLVVEMDATPREKEERPPRGAELTGSGEADDLGHGHVLGEDEVVLEAEDALQCLCRDAVAVRGGDLGGPGWQGFQGAGGDLGEPRWAEEVARCQEGGEWGDDTLRNLFGASAVIHKRDVGLLLEVLADSWEVDDRGYPEGTENTCCNQRCGRYKGLRGRAAVLVLLWVPNSRLLEDERRSDRPRRKDHFLLGPYRYGLTTGSHIFDTSRRHFLVAIKA